MDANMGQNKPRVVIVGAGFGGLRAAKALAGKPVEVTLVDRNNYHLFQPLLYQVATATISPHEIAYPVRASLRKHRNLTFHLGEVSAVNLAEKQVVTDTGSLPYDYLVLALGGETNFFGNDALAHQSFGLKDLEDATSIRNHLLRQFEMASDEPDAGRRAIMLTFVVVGGGPTGVECAGAISELIRIVLPKDYPGLDVNEVRVILLEGERRLLMNMPEDLSQATLDTLRRKHVDVRFGSIVSSYDGQYVQMKGGEPIAASTLIWAAGVRAVSLLNTLGVEQDRLGRVKVDPTLCLPGYAEVFAIGDAAYLEGEDGRPLPMVAPVAMQQASTVSANILRQIAGQPLEKFTYEDPGTLATIGRNQAVAVLKGLKFRGLIAWLLWLGVHIFQLIGFRNRLVVLLDWFWSYLFYERIARLIGPD